METILYTTDYNWISVKKTDNGFYYTERKNRDSIALFLTRRTSYIEPEVLVRFQPLPLDNSMNQQLFPCPITGCIDYDKTTTECAINEAMEEAGYDISDNIEYLGKYAVGTQTNETVLMFWADVTNKIQTKINGDCSYFESISKNEWRPVSYLKSCLYGACQIGYHKVVDILRLNYGNII